jgi:hypothetical protein
MEFRNVGESCRVNTLNNFYVWLGPPGRFLGTGEKEEFRSDDQEQEDIDGTGEVEQ